MSAGGSGPAASEVVERPTRRPLRPGPWAWVAIGVGFVVMGWALLGVFRESERTHPLSWFTFLVGAAVVHDGIVIPVVIVLGAALAAMRRSGVRTALRWAVAVGAIVTLASLPVVLRLGERPDNDTLLPLAAGTNLAVMWAVLLVGSVAVGLVLDRRRGRQGR